MLVVRWPLVVSLLFHPTQIALRQQHPNDAQRNVRQLAQHSNAVRKPRHIYLFINANRRPSPRSRVSFYFDSFHSRHLGRNPFLCDCYLTWLADYLHRKPVETSGVRCESPRRMQRRRISVLRDEKSRCSGKSSPPLFVPVTLIETTNWNAEWFAFDCDWCRSWLGAQFVGNQPVRRWSILSDWVFLQRNHCRLFQ